MANSVAVREDGLGVIALEAPVKTDAGSLLFFDANASDAASALLGSVTVGALPDMVTLSADGQFAVAANEGEPSDDFTVDPEGSISVVSLPGTVTAPAQGAVATADFNDFEEGGSKNLPDGVRVFGPNPAGDLPVSRNLEPEYITVDGGTAYVTLQEANSLAVVDLAPATVSAIVSLRTKDHGAPNAGLDASETPQPPVVERGSEATETKRPSPRPLSEGAKRPRRDARSPVVERGAQRPRRNAHGRSSLRPTAIHRRADVAAASDS